MKRIIFILLVLLCLIGCAKQEKWVGISLVDKWAIENLIECEFCNKVVLREKSCRGYCYDCAIFHNMFLKIEVQEFEKFIEKETK